MVFSFSLFIDIIRFSMQVDQPMVLSEHPQVDLDTNFYATVYLNER